MSDRYQVITQSGHRVVFEGTKEEAFAVKRYANSYGDVSDFYVRFAA